MAGDRRRTALVTGASAGLGREFAAQLAAARYDLVLVARREDRLRGLSADLTSRHGITCETIVADLATDDGVTRVVARLDAAPVDLLVSNAGFGTIGSIVRASREKQEAMLRLHVLATHRLVQAAVQGMAQAGGGAVIIVASVASYLAVPGNANYNATKAYQRFYAEALAREAAPRGIYVQALCPGFTRTEMHDDFDEARRRIPSWAWDSAPDVVRTSLDALRRRSPVVVVPGALYRLTVLLLRFLPRWLINGFTGTFRRVRRSKPASHGA